MNIHQIHDLSNSYVVDILKTGLSYITEAHLAPNYSPNYAHVNSNLFYILEQGRYKQGAYYVIEENGEFIASAGWNKYTDDTALALTRAFVSKPYRATYIMGEKLVPLMIEGAAKYDNFWITCNEYNKAIYNWFYRTHQGKRAAMYNNWPEIYSRFEPIGQKTVYNTEQYVVQLKK